MFTNRREREALAGARAEITSLQSRLAADLNSLSDDGDAASRQALADAGERNNTAGALLASAATIAELQVAQRIIIEGLTATRLVREKQGLPLGPALPENPAPTVEAPTTVSVDGQQHVAYPDYHPQQPHYFPGGVGQAPAGYYKTPFWKKALAVGGAVVGAEALGGLLGDAFDPDGNGGFGGDYGGGDFDGGGW
ncbi:MAG: hypothetical protein JO280_13045 [Mycobacteriaceae bacterium]|nr:hypothetical protein [Mycobacteriaceae bacterium]